MENVILKELRKIEENNDVKVLFACESGSRAWGFPSKNSDYDVRFVYVRPKNHYLSLQKSRDVIEEPISNDLDISGWDIDKTLRLLKKSNPNILEWMQSTIIYLEDPLFEKIRTLFAESFNPKASAIHYLNMAMNNKRQCLDRKEIKIKKYLYTIRPLLCAEWVLKKNSQPPMIYLELLDELHPNSDISKEVKEMVRVKVDMNELDIISKNQILDNWIEEAIHFVEESIPEASDASDWKKYNDVFLTILDKCF